MYIFGVYECVFSVAVSLQPILCKGLKQTIILIPSNRRGHKDWWCNKHNTIYSEAIIYSGDYSSTFHFCRLLDYFIKLNHLLVLSFVSFEKPYFLNATLMLRPSLAAWWVLLRTMTWRTATVLLWRTCWRVFSFEWTHCRTGHIVLCGEFHFFKIRLAVIWLWQQQTNTSQTAVWRSYFQGWSQSTCFQQNYVCLQTFFFFFLSLKVVTV